MDFQVQSGKLDIKLSGPFLSLRRMGEGLSARKAIQRFLYQDTRPMCIDQKSWNSEEKEKEKMRIRIPEKWDGIRRGGGRLGSVTAARSLRMTMVPFDLGEMAERRGNTRAPWQHYYRAWEMIEYLDTSVTGRWIEPYRFLSKYEEWRMDQRDRWNIRRWH
jgi:hypothetical protein